MWIGEEREGTNRFASVMFYVEKPYKYCQFRGYSLGNMKSEYKSLLSKSKQSKDQKDQ